ncbi:hypothetical protein PFMALIP_04548 [Plasmodium falciparum MaliPS096_E11]|uniref:Uncharacterized protein n=1 Tax=Plasmodium falciparum MaliPS096_E11 TaxID=1036727 RepID=A0A024WJH3_PLAFA|nr:hypothetical protein PFMALIP_04548 [Plasmodium falciparum MaliPS096_E11]
MSYILYDIVLEIIIYIIYICTFEILKYYPDIKYFLKEHKKIKRLNIIGMKSERKFYKFYDNIINSYFYFKTRKNIDSL